MRRVWPLLLLCALLTGCGAPPPADLPPEPALEEPEAPEKGGPLDRVTRLPQSLVDELRRRMAAGEDACEDFLPLRADRNLSREEAAAMAPEAVNCTPADWAILSFYSAVDFDNGGIEDLFVNRTMGQGTMGMHRKEFWRGLPGGAYDCAYYEEDCMALPLFITWEGRSYQIVSYFDMCSKDEIAQVSHIGVSAACFADGWAQEYAYLTFDPAALWTEGIYDGAGEQTGWTDVLPQDGDITLEVYTRGVNTDFPLPVH